MKTIKQGEIYERCSKSSYYGLFTDIDCAKCTAEDFDNLTFVMVLETIYNPDFTPEVGGHWIKILTSEGTVRFLWFEEHLENFFKYFKRFRQ